MRNVFALILIAVCSAVVASSQRTMVQKCQRVRDNDRLGPVRSIKIENTSIFSHDGLDYAGSWSTGQFTYDRDGVVLEQIQYDNAGKITYHVVSTRKGNQLRTVRRDMYDKVETSVDTYDNCGNMTSTMEYAADGHLSDWRRSLFDRNGRETGMVFLDPKGEMVGWEDISYDAAGRVVEELYRGTDGKPTSRITYKYSIDNGASTEERTVNHYLDRLTTFRYVTLTKKNSEETRLSYGADGSLSSRSTHEYPNRDSHGNWIVQIDTSWEPDEAGKWIVKSKSKTTRAITYY